MVFLIVNLSITLLAHISLYLLWADMGYLKETCYNCSNFWLRLQGLFAPFQLVACMHLHSPFAFYFHLALGIIFRYNVFLEQFPKYVTSYKVGSSKLENISYKAPSSFVKFQRIEAQFHSVTNLPSSNANIELSSRLRIAEVCETLSHSDGINVRNKKTFEALEIFTSITGKGLD